MNHKLRKNPSQHFIDQIAVSVYTLLIADAMTSLLFQGEGESVVVVKVADN